MLKTKDVWKYIFAKPCLGYMDDKDCDGIAECLRCNRFSLCSRIEKSRLSKIS